MESNKIPMREIITIAIGEVIVGAVICLVFLLCGKFDYKVLLGSLLGIFVTVANFIFLCVSVNRALDKCLAGFTPTLTEKTAEPIKDEEADIRSTTDDPDPEDEPYDDEAAKFAKENLGKLQNAIKLSYVVRLGTVALALVLALLTKQFNVIATVIPLFCLRPILSATELLKRKETK